MYSNKWAAYTSSFSSPKPDFGTRKVTPPKPSFDMTPPQSDHFHTLENSPSEKGTPRKVKTRTALGPCERINWGLLL
jgi:hypothetical protein